MSVLIKVEVAKKQAYIFESNKLKDNVTRSNHISYVTGSEFFKEVAKSVYNEEKNLVYSGGGHAVLRFADKEQAYQFIKLITAETLTNYNGLELFCKQMEYDDNAKPQENLKNLSMLLEAKKSRRKDSFGNISLGIEELDAVTFEAREKEPVEIEDMEFSVFSKFSFPKDLQDIAQGENFLSVIHIDGNAMGKRVEQIYASSNNDFEELSENLRRFSECIQKDFEKAFNNMIVRILGSIEYEEGNKIPVRPIILAGDDVCFVTKGSIGIECARIYLEELTKLRNEQDEELYSACAGVAMVHTKFPFYRAYQLSEELCSNAKKLGASYYRDGSVSSIDWHIEYGQLKSHLSEIRQDYICEDENIMTLRPMWVINPNTEKKIPKERKYGYTKNLCKSLQSKENDVNHGKLKQLRSALKQGELETAYFIERKTIKDIENDMICAVYGKKAVEAMVNAQKTGVKLATDLFQKLDSEHDNVKHCLCFDAIEMMDLYVEIKEEEYDY